MKYYLLILFSLFFLSDQTKAALTPANGAVLNFTQIMFEVDEVNMATSYVITIHSYPDDKNSSGERLQDYKTTSLALLISSGFKFGKKYNWNYKALNGEKIIFTSPLNSFTIIDIPFTDTTLFRYNVSVAKEGKFQNNILFVDNLAIAIDRAGKPVWFLNRSKEEEAAEPGMRNLRMTHDGTLTYLTNNDCNESNIYGKKTWQAPNDGSVSGEQKEFYHHDFRKLKDGTFLTSGYKYIHEPNYLNTKLQARVRYNTLIQYSSTTQLLWSWVEKDHVPYDLLYLESTAESKEVPGTHLNGFDYHEKDDAIIASFRNSSSVIKIDKKTGKVLYDLSDKKIHTGQHSEPWFMRQHGPVVIDEGILIYNNNVLDTINKTALPTPTVMIIKEPKKGKKAKIIWEYACVSDHFPRGVIGKEGYAVEMPNKNILVCMGGVNRTFEVTRSKEVVWECFFEKYSDKDKTWEKFSNYRCNFTSSLFPRYFTIQQLSPLTVKSTRNYLAEIKINNDGSENDTYVIETFSQTSVFPDVPQTISVKAFSSTIVKLSLKLKTGTEVRQRGQVIVKVYPANNKELAKTVSL